MSVGLSFFILDKGFEMQATESPETGGVHRKTRVPATDPIDFWQGDKFFESISPKGKRNSSFL